MSYAKARREGSWWPDVEPDGTILGGGTVPVACCAACGYVFGALAAEGWLRPGGWAQADDNTWYLTARARRRRPQPGGESIELPLRVLCPRCGKPQILDRGKL